ncbi:MAG: glutathione S-transferase family protein [Gammaproteobacteria bacterium]
MIKLYDFPLSGHAHRVRLFLSLLHLPHRIVNVDLRKGEQKTAEFLARNFLGEIPVLEDGDVIVRDSNAILVYLANKYAPEWNPTDPVEAAEVQAWLTTASKEVVATVAAARLVTVFKAQKDHGQLIDQSHALLRNLDQHLENREWLAIDRPTIADISAFSYLSVAQDGDVELGAYPNVRAWLNRIENLKGFVPMPAAFSNDNPKAA